MHRHDLAKVSGDTEYYIKEVVDKFPEVIKSSLDNTKYFSDYMEVAELNKKNDKYKQKSEKLVVDVINCDTIECALNLKKKKFNPLVLNMASNFHPGGGWRKGSMAQEEELFRRSTYSASLEQPHILKKYNLPTLAGIYSPEVIIFRGTNEQGYYLYEFENCESLDFIAVPAVRKPTLEKIDGELRLNAKDVEITENKIRLIFETAIFYGNDSLVLGSLGCGAYNNPPKHVAEIFKKIIDEYKQFFKHISFAVLTDHNDKYGNFKSFKNVFCK